MIIPLKLNTENIYKIISMKNISVPGGIRQIKASKFVTIC